MSVRARCMTWWAFKEWASLWIIYLQDRHVSVQTHVLLYAALQNVVENVVRNHRRCIEWNKCAVVWGGADWENYFIQSKRQKLQNGEALEIYRIRSVGKSLHRMSVGNFVIHLGQKRTLKYDMFTAVHYSEDRNVTNLHICFRTWSVVGHKCMLKNRILRMNLRKIVGAWCFHVERGVLNWWKTLCVYSKPLMIWCDKRLKGHFIGQRRDDCWISISN